MLRLSWQGEDGCGRGSARGRDIDPSAPSTRAVAILLLLGLNLLDVWTTRVNLHAGGLEANPVAAWLLAHGALLAAKTAAVIVIGLAAGHLRHRSAALALWVVVGVYLGVVAHNALQMVVSAA